jgi:hypothetical protein
MALYDGSKLANCAAFLLVESPDTDTGTLTRRAIASAFFVGVPVPPAEDRVAVYLVTARHVVEGSRALGPLFVRVNTHDGSFYDSPIDNDAWTVHQSSDVAATPVSGGLVTPPSEGVLIPIKEFISDRHQFWGSAGKVWLGDPVYFAGFFSQYRGKGRNEPVLRFGNVSLVPEHPLAVPMADGTTLHVRAYLVEARSWGGHSGSPAFLARENGPSGFLGLVSHHYTIPEKATLRGDIADEGSVTLSINAGMAIVIAAQDIVDLLMEDEFVTQREDLAKQLIQIEGDPSVVADMAPSHEVPDLTKDAFLSALGKIKKGPKPPSE